jgi:heptosyltransferase-2
MSGAAETILVRSVNWLGDAVMSTPALMRLREARPEARLTLLSPEKLAGLWEGQRFVDEVMTFSREESLWEVSRRLRARKFGRGLALPNSMRSALELWLARIPVRVGAGRGGRGLFLTRVVAPRPGGFEMRKRSPREIRRLISGGGESRPIPAAAHHVHHYLRLAGALGASSEPLAPRIEVGEEEVAAARLKFGLTQSEGRPWFGLNPGAEYGPAKRWPAERFTVAAVALGKTLNCRWVIFGGPAEVELGGSIARDLGQGTGEPAVNLAGQTSLRELAATLKVCDWVLTNDSGPMHLAAAVGSRVAAIFGSTSPELTGPIFSPGARIVRQPVACSPCFLRECPIDLRCLRGIQAQQVVEAVLGG